MPSALGPALAASSGPLKMGTAARPEPPAPPPAVLPNRVVWPPAGAAGARARMSRSASVFRSRLTEIQIARAGWAAAGPPAARARWTRTRLTRAAAATWRPLPTPAPSPSRKPARRPLGRRVSCLAHACRTPSTCSLLSAPEAMQGARASATASATAAETGGRSTALGKKKRGGRVQRYEGGRGRPKEHLSRLACSGGVARETSALLFSLSLSLSFLLTLS